MSIPQAFKGAAIELERLPTPWAKVQYVGRAARLFAQEIVGIICMVPYALRASMLHRAIQPYHAGIRAPHVTLAKDVRYGPGSRNVLDVYVPASTTTHAAPLPVRTIKRGSSDTKGVYGVKASGSSGSMPVVLFVHGGVWTSGDKWHYAPMAVRLAEAGIVTYVTHYSLFPDATTDAMVREVSDALSYVLDNAKVYGGDASRVTLFGHSAGAHLCAMALLHRAAAAAVHNACLADRQFDSQAEASRIAAKFLKASVSADASASNGSLCTVDGRMPALALLAAGVYDISKHYEYEEERGVHMLSTMERAIGGWHSFPQRSPAIILQRVLASRESAPPSPVPTAAARDVESDISQSRQPADPTQETCCARARSSSGSKKPATGSSNSNPDETRDNGNDALATSMGRLERSPSLLNPPTRHPRFYDSFELGGDAIAHRIFGSTMSSSRAAELAHAGQSGHGPIDGGAGDGAEAFAASLTMDAVALLPPFALLSSCTDLTVPWYESAEMYRILQDAGVPVRHLVYNKLGHADFVTQWSSLGHGGPVPEGVEALEGAAPFARDILLLSSGRVRVLA